MRVTVVLYATLQQGRAQTSELELPLTSTVRTVLQELQIPETDVGVVMVNSRSGTFDQTLKPQDRLTLIPPID